MEFVQYFRRTDGVIVFEGGQFVFAKGNGMFPFDGRSNGCWLSVVVVVVAVGRLLSFHDRLIH
eukprot:scaffold4079_cov44-Cyclotella_meneghiniana.AAC.3